jgi:hypothetical protein
MLTPNCVRRWQTLLISLDHSWRRHLHDHMMIEVSQQLVSCESYTM